MFDKKYLDEAKGYETLGPAYFDARDVAKRLVSKIENEDFNGIIEMASEKFTTKLRTDVQDFMLADIENNVQGQLYRMVDNCIDALLTGEAWAMKRYALEGRYDNDKIRKAILDHVGAEIKTERITDLEKENARLTADLKFCRERY